MPIEILPITGAQLQELLERGEGHFLDFKSKDTAPRALTKHLSAFANADGGELFIGIKDGAVPDPSRWMGFDSVEDANGAIQAMEELFPLGNYFRYNFLRCEPLSGLVLHCEIFKDAGYPIC